METKIKLMPSVPEEVKKWVEFFGPTVLKLSIEHKGFDSLIPYRKLSLEYMKILGLTKENYKEYSKIIEEFNIWDNTNYFDCELAGKRETRSEETICFMNDLWRAKDVLIQTIEANLSGRPPLILTRQVSPPLEAYEYKEFGVPIGKPTGRDFGLLFD